VNSFLQSLDAFRTIPKEFTEATFYGGLLTIVAFFAVALLCFFEIGAFLTTTTTSTVLLDTNFRDTVKISFNITMLDLPCQFATVNILDELGDRRLNVTNNIKKVVMHWHGDQLMKGDVHEDPDVDIAEEVEVIDRFEEVDSEGHHSLHIISEDDFNRDLQNHHMVFVNFFAPWCHWCQRLAPVWEHTAQQAETKAYHNSVKLAKVDCVKNAPLCRKHLVRAYPTILTGQAGKVDLHNMYRGDRSTQAFLDHIEHLDFVHSRMKNGGFEPPKADGVIGEGSEGWLIEGQLYVKRVPGSIAITAHSEWHEFDKDHIDLAHGITHFSFGDLSRLAPSLMKNTAPLDGKLYDHKIDGAGVTHHHYLKIVETTFRFSSNDPVGAYQYTNHYHHYKSNKHLPQVKLQFDIDPMAVVVTESRIPLYRFLTSICAIIGGVFTVLGMVNSGLFYGYNTLVKKMAIGKHA
jgi:thiol-disulfide isomerase/thioredoxin